MGRNLIETGVSWVGAIPESWRLLKVKHGFIRKKEEAHQDNPVILSLARSGVKVRDMSKNEGQIAESYYNYNPVIPGDLLLNPMDLYSGANCSISKVSGVISPAYMNLRAKEGYYPEYYDYYFKTQYWGMAMFAHGKGVSFDNRWTLGTEELFNYYIPVPSYNEQKRIAEFLDAKCAEIDNVISKTEATIEEYKKLKQSVITEAVTKGIRGDRPMKPSGIEWIGDIPEEWATEKLKYISQFVQNKYSEIDGNINYIGLENIVSWNGKYIETDSQYDKEQSLICEANDILFGKLRPYLAKVFISDKKQCCSGEFAVIRTGEKCITKYLWYQLISHGFIFMVDRSTYGTKMPRANVEFIKNIGIAIPSITEQRGIADYLDSKCSEIDKLIDSKQKLLEELQQYKKSVIYEYVTGKKEVQ